MNAYENKQMPPVVTRSLVVTAKDEKKCPIFGIVVY